MFCNFTNMKKILFFISAIISSLTYSQIPDTVWTKDFGNKEVFSVAYSPDGAKIAGGFECPFPAFRIIDGNDGATLFETNFQQLCLQTVQVSANSQYVAIGEELGWLYVYEFNSMTKVDSFNTDNGGVYALDFHPDGNRIAIAGLDGKIRVYEVGTGNVLLQFLAHASGLIAVDYSADGNYIISGGKDNLVKLWNANDGSLIRTFTGHTGEVRDVMMTSDLNKILSCGADDDVRCWDVATGNSLFVGTDHWSDVNTIDITSDNRFAISGSTDQTLKIWDISTGAMVVSFGNEITSKKNWLDISSDNLRVVVGHQNGVMGVWNVGPVVGLNSLYQSTLMIYPNPATDYLVISNPEGKNAELTDLFGRVIYTEEIKDQIVNISSLSKGVYLIVIKNNLGEIIGINKIIKE